MRVRNNRVIVTGIVLIVAAVGFFLFMMSMEAKSNDPVAMMHTVGQMSGVVVGLAVAMILYGLIGKKV